MSNYLSGRTSLTTVQTADLADNAITLAKLNSGTDGNVISYDASGNPVAIATGSDGQVLTSAGAGAPPAFEALPASGGLRLIASTNLDASETAVSGITLTGIDSTYDSFLIKVNNLHPSTDNIGLGLQLGDSSGIDTGASDYAYLYNGDNANDTSYDEKRDSDNAHSMILLMNHAVNGEAGNATGEGISATLWLNTGENNDMAPTVHWSSTFFGSGGLNGGGFHYMVGGGGRLAEITVTQLRVLFGAGNIVSGSVALYGLAK